MYKIFLLEDYKKFLCLPPNTPDYHRPYYIIWVEKFLINLEQKRIDENLKYEYVKEFIMELGRDPRYEEWQIDQALKALNLFIAMLRDKEQKQGA